MRGDLAEDREHRRRQPLARLSAAYPALDAVYRYWCAHRSDGPQGGLLPLRTRVDVTRLAPEPGYVDFLHITGSHPRDYRFRVHGTLIWLDRVAIPTALYANVAWLGTPHCEDVVERRARAASAAYGRLVLPLSEDGRRVSVLAVCISARATCTALRA